MMAPQYFASIPIKLVWSPFMEMVTPFQYSINEQSSRIGTDSLPLHKIQTLRSNLHQLSCFTYLIISTSARTCSKTEQRNILSTNEINQYDFSKIVNGGSYFLILSYFNEIWESLKARYLPLTFMCLFVSDLHLLMYCPLQEEPVCNIPKSTFYSAKRPDMTQQ